MNSLEQYIEDLNPFAWFDANNINGKGLSVPNDGDNVSTWKNIGSNYPDFSKINASRFPVYKKNVQNGNSAVLFTRGTSTIAVDADHLDANGAIPSISYPFTMVTISKSRIVNNGINGVFCSYRYGGITMVQNAYVLDTNGGQITNNFRKSNYITDTCYCIGVRNNVNVVEKFKISDSPYSSLALSTQRELPNQIGGRYTDYFSNFNIWNPRNWDGWIFEVMLFEGDLTLTPIISKKIETYLKLKYNI